VGPALNILIVAPSAPDLALAPEIARVASGNTPTILDQYVSRAKLATTLKAGQFDVIHFAGHSAYDVLAMSDGPLTADELQTMTAAQCHLQMVVLNSCRSAGMAAELHDALHVPVIFHQADAADQASVRYAEVLYGALGADVDLHEAHERARGAVRRAFPSVEESQLPVLMNGDMREREVFQADVIRRLERLEERVSEMMRRSPWHSNVQIVLLTAVLAVLLVDVLRHWPA
jgi:hypothetical protein